MFLYYCSFIGFLGTIIIKCKDLRIIQLDIPGMEESLNIASSIEVKLFIEIKRTQQHWFCSVEIHVEDGAGELALYSHSLLHFLQIYCFRVSKGSLL